MCTALANNQHVQYVLLANLTRFSHTFLYPQHHTILNHSCVQIFPMNLIPPIPSRFHPILCVGPYCVSILCALHTTPFHPHFRVRNAEAAVYARMRTPHIRIHSRLHYILCRRGCVISSSYSPAMYLAMYHTLIVYGT